MAGAREDTQQDGKTIMSAFIYCTAISLHTKINQGTCVIQKILR